jgi:hypothetical protein
MNNATKNFLANQGYGYTIHAHLMGILPEVCVINPEAAVIGNNGQAFLMGDGRWVDKYEMVYRRECLFTFGAIVPRKTLTAFRTARGY